MDVCTCGDGSECLVPIVKCSCGSITVCGVFSCHDLGPLIPLEGRVDAMICVAILSDHLHPMSSLLGEVF